MLRYCVIVSFLCLLSGQPLLAQLYEEQGESRYGYTPIRQNGYWGVIDSLGQLVAPCQYQTAQIIALNCNKPGLLLNGEYCFIAPDTLRCYQQLYGFEDGYAKACNNYLCGYIDTEGKAVMPLEYEFTFAPHWNGMNRVVCKGKIGYIQASPPKIVIPPMYNTLEPLNSKFIKACIDKQGLLDTKGNIALPLEYDAIDIWNTDSLLLSKQYKNNTYSYWVYAFGSNLNPQYLGQREFSIIKRKSHSQIYIFKKENKSGAYNNHFKIVIPFIYDKLVVTGNYILGQLDGFMEVINENGDGKVISINDSITSFEHISKNNKEIYILAKNRKGTALLNSNYERILPDSIDNHVKFLDNDLFGYINDNKMGLADVKGNLLTPPKYDELCQIKGSANSGKVNLLEYSINKKKGLLTLSGKELTSPLYNRIESVMNCYLLTTENQIDGFTDLYDRNGVLIKRSDIVKPIYANRMINLGNRDFNTVVFLLDGERRQNKIYYGLLDKNGKRILPCEYSEIMPETQKYFVVRKHELVSKQTNDGAVRFCNMSVGLADTSNHLILPIKYDRIDPFVHNKGWVVTTDCGKQLLNRKFETLTPKCYDEIIYFRYLYRDYGNLKHYFVSKNGFKGIIRTNGEELLPPILQYDHVIERGDDYFDINMGGHPFCSCGQDPVCPVGGGKWGVIDSLGNVIVEPIYSWPITKVSNLWVCNIDKDSVAMIDEDGKLLGHYNYVAFFASNKAFIAKHNNKWGIINNKCNKMTDYEFDKAEILPQRNTVIVARNGKWGIINSDGQWITQPIYDEIIFPDQFRKLPEGINDCVFYYNIGKRFDICELKQSPQGKWGLINSRGKVITPAIYDAFSDQHRNWIAAKNEQYWGIIDTTGKKVTDFVYAKIELIISEDKVLALVTDTLKHMGVLGAPNNILLPFEKREIFANDGMYINTYDKDTISIYSANGQLLWHTAVSQFSYYSIAVNNQTISVKYLKSPEFYDIDARKVINIVLPDTVKNYYIDYFGKSYDFAFIYTGGKCGLINRNGNLVLLPLYDEIKFRKNKQRIIAILNEKEYWFNYKGKPVK